jgi:Tol biopolymer transport system component
MRGAALLTLLASLQAAPALAQFGQNHVIVRDFDWKVRSTEHFDIYYYEDSAPLVPAAAEILEGAFTKVTTELDIETSPPAWASERAKKRDRWQRRPFFLYGSPNEFTQSNIARAGDGTGGVTEPFKDRFMVYNDGTYQWLEEVTWHEFVHIMQFHVLVSGWWRSGRILKTILYPLWMMEGMPSFVTKPIESTIEEVTIRDAATSGRLLSLQRLQRFGHLKPHQVTLAYKEGSAAMAFLSKQYGRRTVGDMLRLFETRMETGQVLRDLIGIDEREFDRKFREHVEESYGRQVRLEKLREPDSFGGQMTRTPDAIPQFNTSPVFSPDLKTMYYLSTQHSYPPEIRELDVRTGKSRRIAPAPWSRVETLTLGNFANLSRVLDLSRDGRLLLFAGTRKHEDAFYLIDTKTRAMTRKAVPGFQRINQPRFSPDGRTIVFSGMRRSRTDLWLYKMADGSLERLTDDARDDAMPAFTPDGKAVIFSGERLDVVDKRGVERRLYRLDLADKSVRLLEETGVEARDPMVSADGKRVLFVRDGETFSEACELDLETGKAKRLTRTVGGVFAPVYAGDELAFASLRRGNLHIYKGPRADFLDEELPARPRRAPDDVEFSLPGMGGITPSSSTVAVGPERPYKFSYSTDLFIPAAFYSSAGGFFWTSYWQGSDLLGNHQNQALVSFHNTKSYDYQVGYAYQRYRPQLFLTSLGSARERLRDLDTGHDVNAAYHVQAAGVAYPLDRYHRLETSFGAISEKITDLSNGTLSDDRQARQAQAALVRDTVRGRYLVATQGDRFRLSYTHAGVALGGQRIYRIAAAEAHQFIQTGSQATLALRGYGGQAVGRDRSQFVLGGLGGVRGYGRSTTRDAGRGVAVANAEWRFPIASDLNYYMWYFFPDFYFKALFATVFTDAGYVWDTTAQASAARPKDIRHSYGLGLRLYTFILQEFPLVIAADYARRTTSPGGIFYVYLGQLF